MTDTSRRLHAGAWWLWAGGLGLAAAQTRHPLLLALIIAVASLMVATHRSGIHWAGGYRAYLLVALVVIAVRVAFRILLGGDFGETAIFTLPRVPLPQWAGGTGLGGPVTLEEVLAGLYDGLRLAALVVCVGAANTLADPRRLLRSFPRSLGDIATALVVALSLAPQLIETVLRVRRARRLRGEPKRGPRGLRSLLVPVLEDTLGRSLSLAASMDSRGYGRVGTMGGSGWLARAGLLLTGVGMFWLLAVPTAPALPAAAIAAGMALIAAGLAQRRPGVTTRYRPDPWRQKEWLVSGSGVLAGVVVTGASLLAPSLLIAAVDPPGWPSLSLPLAAAVAISLLPLWASHRPDVTRVGARPESVAS